MDLTAVISDRLDRRAFPDLADAWLISTGPDSWTAAALTADRERVLRCDVRAGYDQGLVRHVLSFARDHSEDLTVTEERPLVVVSGFSVPGSMFDVLVAVGPSVHAYDQDDAPLRDRTLAVFPAFRCEFADDVDPMQAYHRIVSGARVDYRDLNREPSPFVKVRHRPEPGFWMRVVRDPAFLVDKSVGLQDGDGFLEFENHQNSAWRLEWDGDWLLTDLASQERRRLGIDELLSFIKKVLYGPDLAAGTSEFPMDPAAARPDRTAPDWMAPAYLDRQELRPFPGLPDAWLEVTGQTGFYLALSSDRERLFRGNAVFDYDEDLARSTLSFAREHCDELSTSDERPLAVVEGFRHLGTVYDILVGIDSAVHGCYKDDVELFKRTTYVFPAYRCEFAGDENEPEAYTRFVRGAKVQHHKMRREPDPFVKMRYETQNGRVIKERGLTSATSLAVEISRLANSDRFVEFENYQRRVWQIRWDNTWVLTGQDRQTQQLPADGILEFTKAALYGPNLEAGTSRFDR